MIHHPTYNYYLGFKCITYFYLFQFESITHFLKYLRIIEWFLLLPASRTTVRPSASSMGRCSFISWGATHLRGSVRNHIEIRIKGEGYC